MTAYRTLLSPFRLKHLELRNRMVSAAHAPGYAENGKPGLRYQLYHEEKAKGGLALTMFGGSSNVSRDSGSIYGQIYVGSDEIIPHFRTFAERIHRHGAALMCQITHMGRRTSWDFGDWLPTIGPSVIRDPAHHSVPREMTTRDIARVIKAFGQAARRCRDGGLEGCEILASVHVLGQFLSPLSNRRKDSYGGSLENRVRFLLEVLEEARAQVGDDFIVGVRYTADESNEGGLTPEDGVETARLIAKAGTADLLNVNGAYGGSTRGLSQAFPGMAYASAPFIELARRVREASGLPVVQSARIADASTAEHAIAEGFLDLVGMTRPHMADPYLVAKLERGEEERIRPCVGAGFCIDRVYGGKDALCIHNAATGRETIVPHVVPPAEQRRKVVVIGGGPAGMEAARVCAERGHAVVLYEATGRLGGQIVLASQATWRKDMIGIADWLAAEMERLGVQLRLNTYAETDAVLAESPDVVIVASGGVPMQDLPQGGADLTVSSWDLLGGHARVGDRVLIFDETGSDAGLSTAEVVARDADHVEIVSPDRMIGGAIGGQNYPVYLRELYRLGVVATPDHQIIGIHRQDNRLRVELLNEYSRVVTEREVDHVVLEQGTVPADDLFHELGDGSRNFGETDVAALLDGRPQPDRTNPAGTYQLFRIGDAVASRNIHAAIYDALRLCRAI